MDNEKNENQEKLNDLSKIISIHPSKIPLLITQQLEAVVQLSEKMKNANSKAKHAKTKADEASTKSADRALFHDKKKEAIESLQQATKDMASAVESNASALTSSFEFQKKLADISKGLFAMGLGNLTNNRLVIRELELKLKNASDEELSELAREELLKVVRQLEQQQDLLKKYENLTSRIQILRDDIGDVEKSQKEHRDDIILLLKKHEDHDELLNQSIETNQRQDEELQNRIQKDEEHDQALQKQIEKDKTHDAEFRIRAEIDQKHDQELAELASIDKRHAEEIEQLQKQFKNFRLTPLISKAAFFLSLISIIIILFQIFK